MQKQILDYFKILLLIAIVVILLVINNNIRVIGNSIISKLKPKKELHDKVSLSNATGIFIGSQQAKLTITAFIDYECGFCQRFMNEVYPSVEKNFIKPGIVNIEFRNLPLSIHANAFYAAKSMICADSFNRFADLQNEIFNNSEQISESSIIKMVAKIGIDKDKFNQCMTDSSVSDKVHFDINECINNKILGTPAFVINNNVYMGYMPYDEFKIIIEKELVNQKQKEQNVCQ